MSHFCRLNLIIRPSFLNIYYIIVYMYTYCTSRQDKNISVLSYGVKSTIGYAVDDKVMGVTDTNNLMYC